MKFTRRDFLKKGAMVAVGSTLVPKSLLQWTEAWAADMPFKPEKGASLRALRWNCWVKEECEQFDATCAAFEKVMGVKFRLDKEWMDDVQPKAAVAANVGKGPDLIWGPYSMSHLFPEKCLDIKDVAEYLGKKYGGWYPIAEQFGKWRDKWINIPFCIGGVNINYRVDYLKAVGANKFPETTDEFLEVSKELKKYGKPGGMALGHASGDGNAWTHWLIWAFGGKMVDENNNVVINSPETIAALEYGKKLYETWVEGTPSWLDMHNNKAFLSEQVSYTNNGSSIYAAAKRDAAKNPIMARIAENMDHDYFPIGPVGVPTQNNSMFPFLAMGYTKYPNAAKAFLTFIMEAQQYNQWLPAGKALFSQTLHAYDNHPFWTEDPKLKTFRDAAARTRIYCYAGDLGYAASACIADFVVIDMVSEALTGSATPQEAAKRAEKRANRYYKI